MAGHLLLLNVTYNDKQVLIEAGANVLKSVFHADKSWGSYHNKLEDRLRPNLTNDRKELPAHSYIEFQSSNSRYLDTFCSDKINKARLNKVLCKCTRPLGIVSTNGRLPASWPTTWDGAAKALINALKHGNVTIEYYKQDNAPLLNLFAKDPGWNLVNE